MLGFERFLNLVVNKLVYLVTNFVGDNTHLIMIEDFNTISFYKNNN